MEDTINGIIVPINEFGPIVDILSVPGTDLKLSSKAIPIIRGATNTGRVLLIHHRIGVSAHQLLKVDPTSTDDMIKKDVGKVFVSTFRIEKILQGSITQFMECIICWTENRILWILCILCVHTNNTIISIDPVDIMVPIL